MFYRLVLFVLLLVSTLACSVWKKSPSGWSGATGGEQLERLFWQNVQAKNWTELDKHLAETFAGISAGGPLDREAFLRDIRTYQLTGFSLTDCTTRLNGADVMIACVTRRDGTAASGGPAGAAATLSVWQQLKKGWVMVAHSETTLAPGSR